MWSWSLEDMEASIPFTCPLKNRSPQNLFWVMHLFHRFHMIFLLFLSAVLFLYILCMFFHCFFFPVSDSQLLKGHLCCLYSLHSSHSFQLMQRSFNMICSKCFCQDISRFSLNASYSLNASSSWPFLRNPLDSVKEKLFLIFLVHGTILHIYCFLFFLVDFLSTFLFTGTWRLHWMEITKWSFLSQFIAVACFRMHKFIFGLRIILRICLVWWIFISGHSWFTFCFSFICTTWWSLIVKLINHSLIQTSSSLPKKGISSARSDMSSQHVW